MDKPFTKTAIYRQRTKRSGNCLVWTGRVLKSGWKPTPAVQFNGETHSVTRLVTGAQTGERVYRRCSNDLCVRRTHLKAISPKVAAAVKELKRGGLPKRTHCEKGHEIHERTPTENSASSRVVRYCPVCTGRIPIAERRARRKDSQAARLRRVSS